LSERKPHISAHGFRSEKNYEYPGSSRTKRIAQQDRTAHGQALAQQYQSVQAKFDELKTSQIETIDGDKGVYVELISFEGCVLPIEKLDNTSFNLRSCKQVEGREVATIFIHESKRNSFAVKIGQYLDSSKDTKAGFPSNQPFIDVIESVRIADLRSLFTDDLSTFPHNRGAERWWELWLKKSAANDDVNFVATNLAERIGARLGNTSLSFFDNVVVLIFASVDQLENSLDLIANLEEVRIAKESPSVIVDSSFSDQIEWANDIDSRVQVPQGNNTSICILDSGVNYNNPLLKKVSGDSESECWQEVWPHYEGYDALKPFYHYHGSLQAGLCVYGDLLKGLLGGESVTVPFVIESGRILPPTGQNDPELYGRITIDTGLKHEINNPGRNRVYSLAVTTSTDSIGGQPSSWSAAMDAFSYEYERLCIISAGNNVNHNPAIDHWDQVTLQKVEDPAQSWNALTVGAYTELTTNSNPQFNGWSPLASAGDISPYSSSSELWEWKKQAPYKPDFVMEGGNLLLSPNKQDLTNDEVSLLTTSGRASGQLFEESNSTSAACALASRLSGIIMSEYPDYWPETVRALMVHSSEWTDKMKRRFDLLKSQEKDAVAKESMLRMVGYGVPSLNRARYSADNSLTLVVQDEIQPFKASESGSDAPVLNEMHLHSLPWPVEELQNLPSDTEVKLKVTLSYFIEPNPGRKGYRNRFTYQSHGLRFDLIRLGESPEGFVAAKSKAYRDKEAKFEREGDPLSWRFGHDLRTRGSIHSDVWEGSAAELADLSTIAITPVAGWWKNKKSENKWLDRVRYSLVVSIETEGVDVDLYTPISAIVEARIAAEVQIEI
jgi:hypothetical protein